MEVTPPTLPLAVLELLAGARLAVLLPLARARIAGEEPRLLGRLPQLVVEARDRAREPVTDGASLAGGPAALHGGEHVELAHRVRDRQRLRDDHPQRLAREVVLERAPVDDDMPGAGLDPHAGHGRLATPGAVEPVEHSRHLPTLRRLDRRLGGTRCVHRERGRLLSAVRILRAAVDL